MDKVDLLRQERGQAELTAHRRFCFLYTGVDLTHRGFEESRGSFAIAHHLFPIPLIHTDRVYRRQTIFIRAQRLHVGIQPFARAEVVLAEGFALPLRQRVNHFKGRVWQGFHMHLNRLLAAGEVVLRAVAQLA